MSDTNKSSIDTPDEGVEKSVESTPGPCPVCYTALDAGANFCPQCGQKLAQDNAAAKEQSKILAKESINDKVFCQWPKQDVSVQSVQEPDSSDTQKAAASTRSESPQKTYQCSCGQNLPAEAQFCYRCGIRISQAATQYRLLCRAKGNADMIINITGKELKIGKSSDCDLVIPDDDYVSRQHACLVQSNGSIILKDFDSSNGTFLRVQRPTVLEPGDEFLIGTRLLQLEKIQA